MVAPAADGIAGAPPSQDDAAPASIAVGAVASPSVTGAPALPDGMFEDPPVDPASEAGISTCVGASPAVELPVLFGVPSLEVPQLTPTPTDKAAKGSQFLRAGIELWWQPARKWVTARRVRAAVFMDFLLLLRVGRREGHEQTIEIVFGDGRPLPLLSDDGVGEIALLLLEREHAFFDAARDDQAVDEHRARLPDAVGAIGRLRLRGGVPPGIVVDDGVGAGEVETGAAGLQADQEDVCLAFGELIDRLLATDRRPGERDVPDAALVHRLPTEERACA